MLAIAEESTTAFTDSIERDETMFDGYRAGKRDWGTAGKVIVLSILQRDGVVRVFPVKGRGRVELAKISDRIKLYDAVPHNVVRRV